jgi:actin
MMEVLWQNTFYEKLKTNPSYHPVLLTEAVINPKADRERMVQIMFETFSVPALYICSRPILCLCASRRSTGVVIHCSSSECCIVPIIDGHVLPHSISRSCFHSGDDLTSHMIMLLQQRGISFPECKMGSQNLWTDYKTRCLVRRLQESVCYIALDCDHEMQSITELTYELPLQPEHVPSAAIRIGSERFVCPEILFRPLLPSVAGIHIATDAVIKSCDVDVQHLNPAPDSRLQLADTGKTIVITHNEAFGFGGLENRVVMVTKHQAAAPAKRKPDGDESYDSRNLVEHTACNGSACR